MTSLLFAFVLLFFSTCVVHAVNITDVEDKIRNQRKVLEETARKLQESSRQQRSRHEEQLRSSRERIEKIKADTFQRTKSRVPVRESEKVELGDSEALKDENAQSEEVKQAHKRLNDFMEKDAARLKSEDAVRRGSKDRAESALNLHGVDDSLIQELKRMSTSSVPRDAMIQHVSKHFPEKKQEEWNDIVISALSFTGNKLPDVSDTDNALRHEAQFKQKKFERSKASFEAKIDMRKDATADAKHQQTEDL